MLLFFVHVLHRKESKMEKQFEQELSEVKDLYDVTTFYEFLYLHADDAVGRVVTGNTVKFTTLQQELAEVAKLATYAYIDDGINYYRNRDAKNRIEAGELLYKNSARDYSRAAKKLLFLNSKCQELRNKPFLLKRLCLSNENEAKQLVDGFEFLCRYYEHCQEQ